MAKQTVSKTLSLTVATSTSLTFYVAPSGNDSNPGTSAAPFKTLQKGVSVLTPGATLLVRAGTYTGFIVGWDPTGFYGIISGTAGAPITIQADPMAAPGTVIVNSRCNKTPTVMDFEPGCDYITVNGFTITNDGTVSKYGIKMSGNYANILNNTVHGVGLTGVYSSFSSNGSIQGNVCYNNSEHGIYASNSPQNVVISGNTCHDNKAGGIQVNADASQGGPGTAQNITIANNVCYNNGAVGGGALNLDGVQNSKIYNNLLYNNHGSGLVLYDGDASAGCINNVAINNTVVQAAGANVALNNNTNSYGNKIYNNIFLGDMLVDATSTPAAFANNILLAGYTNKGSYPFSGTISTAAVLFSNAVGNNYHLAIGSPAIGKGTAISAPAIDLDGNSRPGSAGYDIGCYQTK